MKVYVSWRAAYWALFVILIATAALNMLDVNAGIATSYAADLFVPPWLYVVLRRFPGHNHPVNPLYRWLGSSPERAASSLFVASALTEISQMF